MLKKEFFLLRDSSPSFKPISGRLFLRTLGDNGEIVESEFVCYTLEPCEKPCHGCIPAGRYALDYTYSPRFHRKLPLVCGVPGRSGIRIHSGNTVSDSKGCILVGLDYINTHNFILLSRAALSKVNELLLTYSVDTIVVDYDLPF